MARIRTIKPEFFWDEAMSKCSPHARLLAIALLGMADREGRLRWIPMQIHAHAFPHEPDLDVVKLAHELCAIGYLYRYTVDGREYAVVVNFSKHQRVTGTEAKAPSRLPPPVFPDDSDGNDEDFQSLSIGFPGSRNLEVGSRNLEVGSRNEEREEEGCCAACPPPPQASDGEPPDEPPDETPDIPTEFVFPTKGKGGETWTLTFRKLCEYREAYPDLDIEAELRAARQWCRDHPSQQKTPGGMLGFLTRWFNRSQNRGGGIRDGPGRAPYARPTSRAAPEF